jgi:hypothetical protein
MALHVNKENDEATITFVTPEYENVFIKTVWTIKAGGKGDEITKSASVSEA